jgi:cleavage and polyadenylation specificity factor subunit 1
VLTDTTGIYRTFEAPIRVAEPSFADGAATAARSTAIRMAQQSRMQLTQEQIKRLQDEKPAISVEAGTAESALHANRGSQWLAILTSSGEFQVSKVVGCHGSIMS